MQAGVLIRKHSQLPQRQVSAMPDPKLWSLSLLSQNRVNDPRTREAEVRPGTDPTAVDLPLLYKMLEQVTGAGASIRRFALAGSYGTSWTAMVDAGTEPSFRMMCWWP